MSHSICITLSHTPAHCLTPPPPPPYQEQRLYWCDSGVNRLESILLDGSDRRVFLSRESGQLPFAFGLSISGDSMFVTYQNLRQVLRFPLISSSSAPGSQQQAPPKGEIIVENVPDMKGLDAVDLDERRVDNADTNACLSRRCTHGCLLRGGAGGGATCVCPEGWALTGVGADTCLNVTTGGLLVATGGEVIRLNDRRLLPLSLDGARSLVYDNGRLFWSTKNGLFSALSNGSRSQRLGHSPGGVVAFTLDPVSRNVYAFDSRGDLRVCSYDDGELSRTLFTSRGQVVTVKAHASADALFWVRKLAGGSVLERSDLLGASIVTVRKYKKIALFAVDRRSSSLYVYNAGGDIEVIDYRGELIRYLDFHPQAALDLTFDAAEHRLYVVRAADILSYTTTEHSKVVYETSTPIAAATLIAAEGNYSTDCATRNCSYMCAGRNTCLCPDGVELDQPKDGTRTGRNCKLTAFALVVRDRVLFRESLTSAPASKLKLRRFEAAPSTLHCIGDHLFWLTADLRYVWRGSAHTGKRDRLLLDGGDSGRIRDIAVDAASQAVFFTDSLSNSVNVTRLDRNHVAAVVTDADHPRLVVALPDRGYLAYSSNGSAVYACSYDAAVKCHRLATAGDIAVTSLYADRGFVYWAKSNGRVERVKVDGTARRNWLKGLEGGGVYDLTHYEGATYWRTASSVQVMEDEAAGGGHQRSAIRTEGRLQTFALRTPLMPPEHSERCRLLDCDHLCYVSDIAGTTLCACPAHHTLSTEGRCVESVRCSSTELACTYEGQPTCVGRAWLCDGYSDCDGGVDESDCSPGATPAPPPHAFDRSSCAVRCAATLACVPEASVCDGRRDCSDGSDERHCSLDARALSAFLAIVAFICLVVLATSLLRRRRSRRSKQWLTERRRAGAGQELQVIKEPMLSSGVMSSLGQVTSARR